MTSARQILVIEDDRDIRITLQELLELEGYAVEIAENGQRGLDLLRSGSRPSLILLDMLMPVTDGRTFLDKVAEDAQLSQIPVVIVSATVSLGQTPGARATVRKPADLD